MVTNNNWADMRVYVEQRSGSKRRLGIVAAMDREMLRIPGSVSVLGPVRLIADPIAAPEVFVSRSVEVIAGQRVDFTIQNNLRTSSLTVWGQ